MLLCPSLFYKGPQTFWFPSDVRDSWLILPEASKLRPPIWLRARSLENRAEALAAGFNKPDVCDLLAAWGAGQLAAAVDMLSVDSAVRTG